MLIFDFDQNIEVLNAPFFGLTMGVKIDIQAIALDDPAAVQHLNGVCLVIAGNNHFGAEPIMFVGRDKNVSPLNPMATGCLAIGEFAAAFSAGTIPCNPHTHHLPSLFILQFVISDINVILLQGGNKASFLVLK